jgi:hypothetical protein
MVGIGLFDTEEALRAGDAAMNSGPRVAGERSAVEFYEVAIHTLDSSAAAATRTWRGYD